MAFGSVYIEMQAWRIVDAIYPNVLQNAMNVVADSAGLMVSQMYQISGQMVSQVWEKGVCTYQNTMTSNGLPLFALTNWDTSVKQVIYLN